MATFQRLANGKHQAQIYLKGTRKSKTFRLKSDAKAWADDEEHALRHGAKAVSNFKLYDVFDKYAREHSHKKRGARWEIVRLEKLKRDPIAQIKLSDLKPVHFADWRDAQLRTLAAGSVIREMQIMSVALSVARREWGWIDANPLSEVRKPPKAPARDRLVSRDEISKLLEVGGTDLSKTAGRTIHAFVFAIETGMRAGEIIGLHWDDINLDGRFLTLQMTKNGTRRDVPLSSHAIALLEALPKADPVFDLKSSVLDTTFRRIRDRAKITNLTFHDSRHEAITRLAKKLDVLALARTVGHTDIRQLQTYYNETASDLAKLLD